MTFRTSQAGRIRQSELSGAEAEAPQPKKTNVVGKDTYMSWTNKPLDSVAQGLVVRNNACELSSVTRVSCEDSYILPSRRADRVGPACKFHLDTCGTRTRSYRRSCNQYR